MLNNKCEACGYNLKFSPLLQGLKCPKCGKEKQIISKPAPNKMPFNKNSAPTANKEYDSLYECENCGAKTKHHKNIATSTCPYCGSNNLREVNAAVKFIPNAIVPFRLTTKQAKQKYKEWLHSKKFVPSKLKSSAKLNKMEGAYLGCWNFDYDIDSSFSGIGIKRHTRHYTVKNSNGTTTTRTETYTTRHPFSGTREDEFKDVLMSANTAITNYELNKIGNYNLNKLKVYNPEYLLGFVTYDVNNDLQNAFKSAMETSKLDIKNKILFSYSFDDVENFKLNTIPKNEVWNLTYLPIYVCNFNYKKEIYSFLINGFSGEVWGKVPRSGWKIFGLISGILAVIGLVILLCLI